MRSHDLRVSGRIVLALTANPFYAVRGVRPGTRLRVAVRRLDLGTPIHLGPNYWYVVPGDAADGILKVRHGIVEEVGVADRQLLSTRTGQWELLRNF